MYAKARDSEKAEWLWLAIDPVTKIIPWLHPGEHKSVAAYAVVHELKQRLFATCVPRFLTDGLWSYLYAITAHFRYWFRFCYFVARPHSSLRTVVPGWRAKYRERTPAMAAGLTDHIWTVEDILRTPLIPAAA